MNASWLKMTALVNHCLCCEYTEPFSYVDNERLKTLHQYTWEDNL